MADVALTADKIRDASPVGVGKKINLLAAVAITAGQFVYINSSGRAALADASAAGTAVVIGVALNQAAIGQPIDILVDGFVSGFTLTSVAYNTLILLSDTAGAVDNGAGSPTVSAPVGRVWSVGDSDNTKVLFLNCSYNLNVVPA